MKILTLKRVYKEPLKPVMGVLQIENLTPFCLTLERTWLNNQRMVSCIPSGEYLCKRGRYEKGGYETFEIICPPREEVKFHIGNIDDDTHGCILLGEMFEPVLNKRTDLIEDGILASGQAFKEFMKNLEGEQECRLIIKEV